MGRERQPYPMASRLDGRLQSFRQQAFRIGYANVRYLAEWNASVNRNHSQLHQRHHIICQALRIQRQQLHRGFRLRRKLQSSSSGARRDQHHRQLHQQRLSGPFSSVLHAHRRSEYQQSGRVRARFELVPALVALPVEPGIAPVCRSHFLHRLSRRSGEQFESDGAAVQRMADGIGPGGCASGRLR